MGIESTDGPVCFLFERQIWFVKLLQMKSSFGGPEVGILWVGGNILDAQKFLFFIFFGKHGDEKFVISFVVNLLLQFYLWNSFPRLLRSKAINPLWLCKYKKNKIKWSLLFLVVISDVVHLVVRLGIVHAHWVINFEI